MNEIQLYSILMFATGALLTKAVFFLEQQRKKKRFYLIMSAAVLQVLESVYTVHMAAAEFSANERFKYNRRNNCRRVFKERGAEG